MQRKSNGEDATGRDSLSSAEGEEEASRAVEKHEQSQKEEGEKHAGHHHIEKGETVEKTKDLAVENYDEDEFEKDEAGEAGDDTLGDILAKELASVPKVEASQTEQETMSPSVTVTDTVPVLFDASRLPDETAPSDGRPVSNQDNRTAGERARARTPDATMTSMSSARRTLSGVWADGLGLNTTEKSALGAQHYFNQEQNKKKKLKQIRPHTSPDKQHEALSKKNNNQGPKPNFVVTRGQHKQDQLDNK